jgi:hypothetical protein
MLETILDRAYSDIGEALSRAENAPPEALEKAKEIERLAAELLELLK